VVHGSRHHDHNHDNWGVMRTFTDAAGEQWQINITAGSLMDVVSELGYDLSCGIEILPNGITERVSLIAVLLRDQINDRKLTERQFAHRLSGDAYGAAIMAVIKELAFFLKGLRPSYAFVLERVIEEEEKSEEAMQKIASEVCSNQFSGSADSVE
jgi:hypothetical protein